MGKLFHKINRYMQRYAYEDYCSRTKKMYEKKMTKVKSKNRLTSSQKKEIRDYYKGLTGKNISTIYHEYFYARTGIYSKEYMPIDLYEADIIGRANRLDADKLFSDKNMDDILLPSIRHPRNILKNMNGYFYEGNQAISEQEAIQLCQNIDSAIIKPTQLSWGRGVQKITVKDGLTGDGINVEDLFREYKSDFIIQECVQQHEKMAALNPTSINTIRIMTYRSDMEIIVVYTAVRIGRRGQVTDNQSKGGISAKIDENGCLCKYGFGSVGDDLLERTDSGIVLEGYKIPFFHEAVDAVKQAHYSLPFYNIVGWDIAIAPDGPVMIEWNSRPGPSQTACGTGLGKYTERIIKEIYSRKNTRLFLGK